MEDLGVDTFSQDYRNDLEKSAQKILISLLLNINEMVQH